MGHVTNLHEVGRQGLPEGLIECTVIPYLREGEGALFHGYVNWAGCFSQEHTCWLASVGWAETDSFF